jgi:hypothetical protein
MKKKQETLKGLLMVLIGIFFIYWAQTHSPNAGLGKIMKNEFSGSYTLSESWYYITMIFGIAATVLGLFKVYKDSK